MSSPAPLTRLDADVVVVGAGFAGLAAAVRAQELGARVVVIERTAMSPSYSNSRMAGGMYHVSAQRPTAAPELIEAKILKETEGHASEAVAHAIAHENQRAWEWTKQQGARYANVRSRGIIMAPLRPNTRGNVWKGWGPDRTLRCLYDAFARGRGVFLQGARARVLGLSSGRVTGVVAETGDGRTEVRARGVVLADGGFQADAELLAGVARVTRPELLMQRGAATGSGDALRMAIEAGCRIVNPEALYGHVLHADAASNSQLSPYPMLDTLMAKSVLVGADGLRFCDEGRGGLFAINRIVRGQQPGPLWLLFDREVWHTAGSLNQIVPPNPNLVLAGARFYGGGGIHELARAIGVPAASLESTMRDYNSSVGSGGGTTMAIPRSGRVRPLASPLFAVPVLVGLTYTMGGPLIDGAARVLTDGGSAIGGLYAGGGAAGGVSGGPAPAYEGGIAVALTFGLIAGETAARESTGG